MQEYMILNVQNSKSSWNVRSGQNNRLLGPRNAYTELVGPGTAFRCVPSYFNRCIYVRK